MILKCLPKFVIDIWLQWLMLVAGRVWIKIQHHWCPKHFDGFCLAPARVSECMSACLGERLCNGFYMAIDTAHCCRVQTNCLGIGLEPIMIIYNDITYNVQTGTAEKHLFSPPYTYLCHSCNINISLCSFPKVYLMSYIMSQESSLLVKLVYLYLDARHGSGRRICLRLFGHWVRYWHPAHEAIRS